jgi:sugar phosphate isomerase/epimerase
MVQIAVSSMFFHEYSSDMIFDFIEEAGCSGIEFWVETPHFWLQELPVEEIQSLLPDHPRLLPLTVHSPILDLNPCSINPAVAAVSIHYALRAIEIADQLGATVITVHPGRRTAKRVPGPADYLRFEYYLDLLREHAQKSSVHIAMENMEAKVNSLLCTPLDARELLERESWLDFTLDVAHALSTSRSEVIEYIDLCHERLVNVHISAVDNGMVHLPAAGNEDVGSVLALLGDYGYSGYLTLEIEDRNFDHDLSSEEKITLISHEVAFLEKYFA